MTFLTENPTQLEFQISPDLAQQCWLHSQSQPSAKGQWNAYLNQICLQTILPWLQAEYEPQASILLNESLLPSFWEVVNGTALNWGNKRLIIIPEKTIDTSEYRIPQEWIDVPKLVGDYYLAVQINPDDLSMRVWGYTTHEKIKTSATYNGIDRTYSLDTQEIIQDLNVLWVVTQLNPEEETRVSVASLSAVPATQAENLLSRLANPDIIQPRLELPFVLWGELVSNDNWRQKLYQLRQGELESNLTPRNVAANISQWLQNAFEESWQSLDSLLGTNASLGFSFRNASEENDTIIKKAKSLNLPNGEVLLVVGLDTEADGRIGIRIQLRSLSQEEHLPSGINLKLLSSSGQIIQSTQARSQDNIIQLKRFKISSNTQFSIQIELDDFIVTENFEV
ncbi:DUF1822 family protein [Brunnivagina elsteri]|uniref:DUF1822 domain-containing protein n=1 Tax=Brunnivagina elsteri CCALA 953 TaxID=987040 RepID=A0A2A2TC22_9CYAN|nr:DUF1822 family protein [Calothrix elsteri]PAX51324.1 hypothetical protein CK510_25400 [Calothrix elsteri CCALA 953]